MRLNGLLRVINDHLPHLRPRTARDHAGGCLSVLLRMRRLPYAASAQARSLLRLLLLRHRRLSADPGRAAVLWCVGELKTMTTPNPNQIAGCSLERLVRLA